MISRIRCVLLGANVTGAALATTIHQTNAAFLMGACALVFFTLEMVNP